MGNREDLLAGARKAILERGVAKTTARDIAAAAGVSLAAIGYHFGSKDQLITEALNQALGTEIGDGMEALIREHGTGHTLAEAFAPTWNGMRELIERNRDGLLASLENAVRVSRSTQAQAWMADGLTSAVDDLTAMISDVHPDVAPDQARAVGEFYFLLMQGLAMLWLVCPDGDLPNGDRLALAVSALS